MRLLYVPVVTHKTWATESEITQFRRFARTLYKYAGVISYMMIPSDMSDDLLVDNEPPFLYHIRTGPWKKFPIAMAQLPKGFERWCNIGLPGIYADAVVTTRTCIAGYMQRTLWDGKGSYLPVFIQESMAADYSTPMVKGVDDIDLMARSFSYAACTPIFSTSLEKKVAITAARRYLTPTMVKEIDDKAPIFPHGLDFANVKRIKKKVAGRKNRSFTVFFGGRLNAMKRAEQLIDTYDKFYAAGRPIRVVITSPLPTIPDVPREIEIYDTLNTEQFLEKCCKAHVFLSSSRIEGFSIGLHEQMATGIVTILPNLPWAKALLKEKWDDYPFTYKTFAEAYGWLKWIYENYDEACAKVKWVPKWLEDNVDEDDCSMRIYEFIAAAIEDMWPPEKFGRPGKLSGNGELIEEMLGRMPDKFRFKDLLYAISNDPDNQYRDELYHLGSRGKFSAWQLYSYLSGFNDLDDVGGAHPTFQKA